MRVRAADAKVTSIVAGMAAGADSIDDLAMLRHGAMPIVVRQVSAPRPRWALSCVRSPTATPSNSTPCTAGSWANWPRTPRCFPAAEEKAFIDVDSTHKRVYGRAKQGAEYGRFKGIRTLHPLLATICTRQLAGR